MRRGRPGLQRRRSRKTTHEAHVPPTPEEVQARRDYEDVYAHASAALRLKGWYPHHGSASTWYPPEDPAWWQFWRRRTYGPVDALREIREPELAAELEETLGRIDFRPL